MCLWILNFHGHSSSTLNVVSSTDKQTLTNESKVLAFLNCAAGLLLQN